MGSSLLLFQTGGRFGPFSSNHWPWRNCRASCWQSPARSPASLLRACYWLGSLLHPPSCRLHPLAVLLTPCQSLRWEQSTGRLSAPGSENKKHKITDVCQVEEHRSVSSSPVLLLRDRGLPVVIFPLQSFAQLHKPCRGRFTGLKNKK